ncbi:NYN domain-containing protein [Fulvivirgaceae bacterium PWU4]|uniref:NYN domain-containing protein n=1 Tax=Chryseosolibacter histidini TaxID=2782349 RepID=A0AAP2DRG5_9BACT|nr:NYN domain-containing protein [Chryseosolibacter histidini]MBT1701135.1 NYN domain-containing protein [Chryseosolibacter histidini]
MALDKTGDLRLAVLIDADNVPYSNVKGMMEEIAKYGTPTFKRIYGDWTKPTTSGWKTVLLQNAITPIQQYSYTTGKNATDSAMIIDAMDILYSGRVEGFCIVSSDSDFTRLATRLREAGMKVIGIGERKTPEPFITACDKFIYIEILAADDSVTESKRKKQADESPAQLDKRVIKLIKTSINDLADESGWAFLGEVGTLILKKQPNFDPRNYGYKKLLLLMKAIDSIETDERQSESGRTRHVYVKVK